MSISDHRGVGKRTDVENACLNLLKGIAGTHVQLVTRDARFDPSAPEMKWKMSWCPLQRDRVVPRLEGPKECCRQGHACVESSQGK